MHPNKGACAGESATSIFEMSVPQRPCMNHVRPDLQSHRDIGPTGARGKSSGVSEQSLVRTDLD
jgi:hypothetical protein